MIGGSTAAGSCDGNAKNEDASGPPFISVVIPVYNEAEHISETLQALLGQSYPADRFELLVADGGSTDETRDIVGKIAARDDRVRLLDNPGRRSSSGRNAGFRAARGEIAMVVDGHVSIESERLLESVGRCFHDSGADCLGRPQPLVPVPGNDWSRAICHARGSFLGHSTSSYIYGSSEGFVPAASHGAAYKKHVFERVGYVDESFDACEDLEFNTRIDAAGLSCYTSPDLTVRYFARTGLRALFRQMHRYGFGRYKYRRRHPRHASPTELVPAALVAYAVLWPATLLAGARAAAVAAAPLLLYALLVAAVTLALSIRHDLKLAWRLALVFPVIHAGLGAGYIESILRGGRMR